MNSSIISCESRRQLLKSSGTLAASNPGVFGETIAANSRSKSRTFLNQKTKIMKNLLIAGLMAGLLAAAPAMAQTEPTQSKNKEQIKKGTHEVGHGAKDVGKGTKDVAVGSGKAVGKGAKKVGKGAVKGTKKAGKAVGNTAEKGAEKAKDVVD